MLKGDVIWPKGRRFRSGSEWEPSGFFSDCLCNSTTFDLMLGFFSSSAVSVLADGFAAFLYNGGRMRLIINDILTDADRDAIRAAGDGTPLPVFDLSDLESTASALSERGRHFFECMSWLIRNGRIDLRIVRPVNGVGVAHTKCGVFCDGVSKVGFDGSVNFSLSAFIQNKEGLTCSCSWDNEIERYKIVDIEEEFERTFSGNDDSVMYLDAERIRTRLPATFRDVDLAQLLEDEYEILRSEARGRGEGMPVRVKDSLQRAQEYVRRAVERLRETGHERTDLIEPEDDGGPKFPFPSGPRDYQSVALQRWKNNGQMGLFNMATGTGKTLTALNCLLEVYLKRGYYKAIILVPTITLVEQWEKECTRFRFGKVVRICSRNTGWESEVARLSMSERFEREGARLSYIVICTYASFTKDRVFQALSALSPARTMLIADEAHNMGAASLMRRLPSIPFKRRIGLSATPDRQFDDEGNAAIRAFFNAKDDYTFEYTMEKAIGKALCEYEYYPHVVRLTDAEMEKYREISDQLIRFYNSDTGRFPERDEVVKRLLLKRKNIIHKAANKLPVFREIIHKRLEEKGNLKYTLVYAPEGSIPDSWDADCFDERDYLSDDVDTSNIISAYTAAIRDADSSVTVRMFTSVSSERDIMLEDFASGELQVLTSMKCLDEGVDVPRSELAIFCASTGNPRQFIQRRGRILRKHEDKKYAIIHDLVAVPEVVAGEDCYKMERSLLAGELRRVRNFALLSMNASAAVKELDCILDYYNLSMFDN